MRSIFQEDSRFRHCLGITKFNTSRFKCKYRYLYNVTCAVLKIKIGIISVVSTAFIFRILMNLT